VEEVDDGGSSGTSRSEGELVIKCEIRWRTVEGGIDERSDNSSLHHACKYWSDRYRPKVCDCLWCTAIITFVLSAVSVPTLTFTPQKQLPPPLYTPSLTTVTLCTMGFRNFK